MKDHDQRLVELEEKYLKLEASQIFQVSATGTLLALISWLSENLPHGRSASDAELRRIYSKKIREETEKFLAGVADHDPKLAHALREILKQQLDAKP